MLCLICTNVCRESHQVTCCGRVFCKSCIEQVKTRSGSCPNCRHISVDTFSDQRSDRQIKHLRISCCNEEDGCSWSGTLADYNIHKNSCEYIKVDCPNSCEEKIQRINIDDHVSDSCPRRKVACSSCSTLVPFIENEAHLNTDCPRVEITCPNSGCRVKVTRDQLRIHKAVCPKEVVTCEFSEGGCAVRVFRKDITTHMRDHNQRHLNLALVTITNLKGEIDTLKKELDSQTKLCTLSVVPITFRMGRYSERKENRQMWCSREFYSHPGGYKLKLVTHPGGLRNTRSSPAGHLSLYLECIRDEHDGHLVWPMCYDLDLQILNQLEDDNHFSRELATTPRESQGMKNLDWGYRTFIPHSTLERVSASCRYIDNDCIYFRIPRMELSYDHSISSSKPWLSSGLIVDAD